MKLLIVYHSRHHYTRRRIARLMELLPEAPALCDLRRHAPVSPAEYDRVILGGPVYMGRITPPLARYMQRYGAELVKKPLAIFISCILLDKAEEQMKASFPEPVFEHASCRAFLGGALELNKLNFVERLLTRAVGEEARVTDAMGEAALTQLAAFGRGE